MVAGLARRWALARAVENALGAIEAGGDPACDVALVAALSDAT